MKKDDLLNLNNNENKNSKKIIIYIAVAFLIFVIGVILFALFGGNKKENNTVIPPQVKEEPIFKEIPIEKENKKENNETLNIKKIKNEAEKNIQQEVNQKNIEKKPKIENNKSQEIIQKKAEVKKNIKQVNTKLAAPKPIKNKILENKQYYIQVAALMKYSKPNEKFLKLLKKYGYKVKLYPITIVKNGKEIKINKLLVGPFKTKEEAKKELIKIKRNITQNAFIFKVK